MLSSLVGFASSQTAFFPSDIRNQSRSLADEGARGQASSGVVASKDAMVMAPSNAEAPHIASFSSCGMGFESMLLKIAVP